MSPTVKVLLKMPMPETSAVFSALSDGGDLAAALKAEEIAADCLSTEERNHTTDDRDPFQRWEE